MKKAILSKKYYTRISEGIPDWLFRGAGFRILFLSLFLFSGLLANAQVTVSGVSLDASSPNDLTIDELSVSFTEGASVTETSTAWYKDGQAEALLQLPFEADVPTALLDYSGSGNNATLGADPLTHPVWGAATGYNGSGGFTFDGGDYINAGAIFPLSSSYTKLAWVNMSGSGFRNVISSVSHITRNHFLKVNSDGRLNAGHSEGTPIVIDSEVLTTDVWHLVGVTFDYATGEMILYKDGQAVDTQTVHDTLRNVEVPSVLIGAMLYTWGWVGAIDEPRIYDYVLSPEQINSFYVNGFNTIVPEETQGWDLWRADVTPFSSSTAGTTVGSNDLRVNSTLVTQIADQTVTEGSSFGTIDLDDYVIDYDFADDQLSWSSSGNTELTVDIATDHVVTVSIPGVDWFGSEVITFTVLNPNTETHDIVVNYTVESVNDAPVVAVIVDQSTDEDVTLTGIAVNFTDADAGDTHTITIESDDVNVTPSAPSGNTSGSTFDLVPAADWNGTALITVTVTDDGEGTLSDTETFTLTVNPMDDAPVISEIGDQDVDEDDFLMGLVVSYTDADAGDTHTIDVSSDEANVTVANISGDVSGSTYDLVPAANWNGTAQITVTVTESNGSGLLDTEVYTLTVNPVNDAPDTILLSNDTIDERVVLGTAVGLFTTTDVDAGDTHTYTFASDGGIHDVDNAAFTIVGDTLKTNAEVDYELQNSYSILVQSDDGQGGTKTVNFTITVNDVNETAVEDFYMHPAFSIYPVPATDHVTVEIDNPENRELLLEIYYATGAVVHSEPIFDKKRVDLSGFKDGMYIVRISGERVYGTRKLIVKDR